MAIVKVHYYNNDNRSVNHRIHIIIDEYQKSIIQKGKTGAFSVNNGIHHLQIFYDFPRKYIETEINICENKEYYYIYKENSLSSGYIAHKDMSYSAYRPGIFYEVNDENEFENAYKEKRLKLGIIFLFIILFWIIFLFF